MTHAAAVTDRLAFADLPQRAAAFRARETGRPAVVPARRRRTRALAMWAIGTTRSGVVTAITLDGIPATSASCGSWTTTVPPASATAAAPTAPSSSAPESTTATARSPGARERAEHRVGGGADAVLLRAVAQLDGVRADQQVLVGGRDVDRAGAQAHAVLGHDRRQRAVAGKDRGQQAPARRRDVEDHAHRRVKSGGQVRDSRRSGSTPPADAAMPMTRAGSGSSAGIGSASTHFNLRPLRARRRWCPNLHAPGSLTPWASTSC